MRACSRRFAGSASAVGEACGIGSVTRRWSVVLIQLVSSNNARTAAISPARPAIPVPSPPMPPYSQSLLIGELDLLGSNRCDHRTGPLLDPATHPDRLTLQPSWVDASRSEFPPVALENSDSKVLRPAPPEIQVYCGAAFPHRQDLAFHQRKLPPRSRNPVNIFRPQRGKIGVGPESASRRACAPFGAQQHVGAGLVADSGGYARLSIFQHSLLDRLFAVTDEGERDEAVVAIPIRPEPLKPQVACADKRLQCAAAAVGDFDSRQPKFAAICQQHSASVSYAGGGSQTHVCQFADVLRRRI